MGILNTNNDIDAVCEKHLYDYFDNLLSDMVPPSARPIRIYRLQYENGGYTLLSDMDLVFRDPWDDLIVRVVKKVVSRSTINCNFPIIGEVNFPKYLVARDVATQMGELRNLDITLISPESSIKLFNHDKRYKVDIEDVNITCTDQSEVRDTKLIFQQPAPKNVFVGLRGDLDRMTWYCNGGAGDPTHLQIKEGRIDPSKFCFNLPNLKKFVCSSGYYSTNALRFVRVDGKWERTDFTREDMYKPIQRVVYTVQR